MEDLKAAVKYALNNNDAAAAAAMIREYLENQNYIPLDIAITGESGAGKSTFVNAFRGVGDDDEGAAPTGVTETTRKVTQYRHPRYPSVTLWDLPGMGTINYAAADYLKYVEVEKFDFFIIIRADNFKENDVTLAKEIRKMKKKFYFVRSKVDNDIRAEKRKRNFSEERTLKNIRENCARGLQRHGLPDPKIFLVSSFNLDKYDFPLLHGTLRGELPAHETEALLSVMSKINLEVIKEKKEAFLSKIKYYAFLSAGVAAVPLPGLSAAVDLGMIVKVVKDYITGFGLDKSSLERLAASTGVSYIDLCAVTRSPLVKEKITTDLILRLLMSLATTVSLIAAEEGSRWIPVVGFAAAAGLSFMATDRALKYFLSELADDAHNVFKRALGL